MKKILLLIPLCLIVSCIHNEVTLPEDNQVNAKIPIDEALSTLTQALSIIHPQTKSGDSAIIEEILTVSKKTIVDDALDEDLAYVVNFSNNQGFALLAADRNLPDPIIAILENGTMDQQMKIHYAPQTKSGSDQDTISAFIQSLLNNYILYEGGGGNGDDDEEHPDDEPEDPGDPWYPGPGSDWTVTSSVIPLVPLLWGQGYPFNERYPINSGTIHQSAGCVPIAVSMILAYHQYPDTLNVNWTLVNNVLRVDQNNGNVNNGYSGFDDVADLVYYVGQNCDMIYLTGVNQTFAWPEDAKDFLYSIGFTNATNHLSYDLDLISDMLEDEKPVFIASISGLFQGHAWIIDGMIRLQNGSATRNLLHCNMGWYGQANGYYASKVFRSDRQISAFSNYGDQAPDNNHTFNYHFPFRIITY